MPIPIGAAAGITKGWELIGEIVTSSDVDYIEFTGLDINTDKFYMLVFTVKNPTVTGGELYIYVNGDTTNTNYYTQRVWAIDTSVSADRQNYPSLCWVEAGERAAGWAIITRDPDGYAKWVSNYPYNTGSTVCWGGRAGSKTATVANITSIRLQHAASGGIGAGSIFKLFRVVS